MRMPPLAQYYISAMKEEYCATVTVPKTKYKQFAAVEKKLLHAKISPGHYARTMARLWNSWVCDHNKTCVPIGTFLGQKSLEWYADHRQKASVEFVLSDDLDKGRVHQIEYEFAIFYLANYLHMSEEQALSQFSSMLGSSRSEIVWNEAKATGKRPIRQVIDTIIASFPLYSTAKHVSTYSELLPVHLDCVQTRIRSLQKKFKNADLRHRSRFLSKLEALKTEERNLRQALA